VVIVSPGFTIYWERHGGLLLYAGPNLRVVSVHVDELLGQQEAGEGAVLECRMTSAADLLRAVARIHDLPDGPISEPAWPGVVNWVNIVGSGTDRYVIRTPRGRVRAEEFAIEAWCAGQAREHAIPTADILGVGVVNAVAYSVQRFVAGANGETVRSAELWRTLGRYARTISAIPLADAPDALFSRFGRDLPAAWRAHLDYNVDSLNDADPLLELGVYERAEQSRVRCIVESLRDHSFEFGLSHGDLALRNLLVDPGRPPVLIDWGSAATGPAPHTDLLNLLRDHDRLDNPRDDELTFFSEGYGVDLDALRPQLDAMQTLASVDLVRWARDQRPDLLDQTIAAARERVTGLSTRR
jgi:aminoglycoside phosphotransferase (APT) family kinase protein